jgi:excisionase family DNA binding protein
MKKKPKKKAPAVPRIWYTVEQAAAALHISQVTLYSHIKSGKIASRKIGARRLIPASAIEEGA